MPALLLNYFGQGALVLSDPSAADNPFSNWRRPGADSNGGDCDVRPPFIASQALISGVSR